MTSVLSPTPTADGARAPARSGLPAVGPAWYPSIMGTGIVATAAASLPIRVPGVLAFATAVWLLAALLLVTLTAAWTVRRVRGGERTGADPVAAQSWGAVAMGVMTVGAGAVLLGEPVIGRVAAVATGWTLWSVGTAIGLCTTLWIPYLMITRYRIRPDSVSATWLLPVVPPMVSAADGALLVPHTAAGTGRETMLLACCALFGISLFATLAILPQIWHRLVVHGAGPAAGVPTIWIVLGPIGQSVTAANLLATQAPGVLPEPYATGAAVAGLLYGVPAWGFAMIWLALAACLTIRTARTGLPFSLSWWSFTFPLGTVVTGTSALAARVHLPAFAWVAMGLYGVLVAAWIVVAARTAVSARPAGHRARI